MTTAVMTGLTGCPRGEEGVQGRGAYCIGFSIRPDPPRPVNEWAKWKRGNQWEIIAHEIEPRPY
jgi:hypothetical protein